MSTMIERIAHWAVGAAPAEYDPTPDVEALLALVEDAREVLEPFREAATHVPADQEDFKIMGHVPGGHHADAYRRMGANLTAGNLRNAAALLAKLEGK